MHCLFQEMCFFSSLFIISVPVYTQHNLSVYTFAVSQSTLPNQNRAVPRLPRAPSRDWKSKRCSRWIQPPNPTIPTLAVPPGIAFACNLHYKPNSQCRGSATGCLPEPSEISPKLSSVSKFTSPSKIWVTENFLQFPSLVRLKGEASKIVDDELKLLAKNKLLDVCEIFISSPAALSFLLV